jgi:hypothetical protein
METNSIAPAEYKAMKSVRPTARPANLLAFGGDVQELKKVLTALLARDPDSVNARYDFFPGALEPLPESFQQPALVPSRIRSALAVGDAARMTLEQRWLLKYGFSDSTLLHYACAGDQLEVVDLLLGYGAAKDAMNVAGRYPEYYTFDDGIQNLLWSSKATSVARRPSLFAKLRAAKEGKNGDTAEISITTQRPGFDLQAPAGAATEHLNSQNGATKSDRRPSLFTKLMEKRQDSKPVAEVAESMVDPSQCQSVDVPSSMRRPSLFTKLIQKRQGSKTAEEIGDSATIAATPAPPPSNRARNPSASAISKRKFSFKRALSSRRLSTSQQSHPVPPADSAAEGAPEFDESALRDVLDMYAEYGAKLETLYKRNQYN